LASLMYDRVHVAMHSRTSVGVFVRGQVLSDRTVHAAGRSDQVAFCLWRTRLACVIL